MKKKRLPLEIALVAAAFAALLCAPGAAADGAKKGLSVCAGIIVPSLLPFLVLSGLVTGLGLPQLLARLLEPLLRRGFGMPGAAAAPFFLGLTGGYPVGAVATAELVRRGEADREQGERMLAFCNNTGPAFIVGAAGGGIFGSAAAGLLLYGSHILAAILVGVAFSARRAATAGTAAACAPDRALAELLPECVKTAVATVLNICGFVVLFSVLTALLETAGILAGISGWMSLRLGLELRFCRALLTGMLELGSGVSAMSGLSAAPRNLALASFLLGFGGLSVHCQTVSAVDGSGMRLTRHFFGRLLHGTCAAGITLLLASLGPLARLL